MSIKKWKCEYESHKIELVNEWNWSWESKEELFVDWKSVFVQEKNMNTSNMADILWTKINYNLDDNTKIEILAGSAWHLCWVAAKILVNWKQIWGDKIVLFARK